LNHSNNTVINHFKDYIKELQEGSFSNQFDFNFFETEKTENQPRSQESSEDIFSSLSQNQQKLPEIAKKRKLYEEEGSSDSEQESEEAEEEEEEREEKIEKGNINQQTIITIT